MVWMHSYCQIDYRIRALHQNEFWMTVLKPTLFAERLNIFANYKCRCLLLVSGRLGLAQTLGTRLKAARQAVFVGREREQKRFLELLTGNEAPGVWWLHGPGGVGKSS